jgi:siderophore synthetase component
MYTDDTLETALSADHYDAAGRALVEKTIAAFCYEDLLAPERIGGEGDASAAPDGGPAASARPDDAFADARGETARYELDFGDARYRYTATERLADSVVVHEGSVRRHEHGEWAPATDPVALLLDARDSLGTDEMTAGHLIREYRNTLVADAHVRAREAGDLPESVAAARDDRAVADAPYEAVEGEMTGHPWITYNKGRLGWSYRDYRDYAPELKERVTLSWLAVREERATFSTVEGLTAEGLLREELGDRYGAFRAELADRGFDPDAYTFLPVHDWQWENSIVQLYSREIADGTLVPLGDGDDEYLPGQSVRTFFNATAPEKRNVKLPMRILNTLVWRGLPGDRTTAAPLVTEYVKGIRDDDPFLREECNLLLPGEVAGVDVPQPAFDRLSDNAYQYDELLGAVWRESVSRLVDDDERPITLSALLHVEGTGGDARPVVSDLVGRSPLSLSAWLDELFEVTLPPLLHYLYRYGTVFSPHGENTILVLDEQCVPTRLGVKDFVDDVNVSDRSLPELRRLDDDLRSVLRSEPPEGLCQFVFCGLFVGVYRYLSDLLTRHHGYDERAFWTGVRRAIENYQARFPDLEERFELFDLTRPTFTKLTLNRNRIVEEGYGDAPGRPHAAEHGTVRNPLYEVRDRI